MTYFATVDTPVKMDLVDHRGRTYGAPYTVRRKSPYGPGYAIFANSQNGEYGGRLIAEALIPELPLRKHAHYNCRVRYGYRTIREAMAACLQHTGYVAKYVG
jgi:hypothetical protein